MEDKSKAIRLQNPFRPGAGHAPPFLAGRETEKGEFRRLLEQEVVLANLVVTGLRGVGKTVLVEEFKPIAYEEKWLWIGTDLSESASISEDSLAYRLLADISGITFGLSAPVPSLGPESRQLDYPVLRRLYDAQPGLSADKLKNVLEFVWGVLSQTGARGVVFAYDEAQTMDDHVEAEQFPLSLLLDVFQSVQRRGMRLLLVLAGLPTLFPKLVSVRTYAERMFNVMNLGRLSAVDSQHAIVKPIRRVKDCPIIFSEKAIANIIEASDGYPYFIQFICKEAFDTYAQQTAIGARLSASLAAIIKKLDKDFFAGRWAKATDRQKDLLKIIARLRNSDEEFTVQDIVKESRIALQPFSSSLVNQMLVTLGNAGFVYKNRHGKYSFAVPLLGDFIRRQEAEIEGKQLTLPISGSFE